MEKNIAKLAIEVEVNSELADAFWQYVLKVQNGCYMQDDINYHEEILNEIRTKDASEWGEWTLLELSHFLLFRAGFQSSNGMQLTDWDNEQ